MIIALDSFLVTTSAYVISTGPWPVAHRFIPQLWSYPDGVDELMHVSSGQGGQTGVADNIAASLVWYRVDA